MAEYFEEPSLKRPKCFERRSWAFSCRAALYGLFIGDALAMPVHWYYDRSALKQDYGFVTNYLEPRNPHPDSIMWRAPFS